MNRHMPPSEPPKVILSLEGQDRLFKLEVERILNIYPGTPADYRTFNIVLHMVVRQIVDCFVTSQAASMSLLSKMPVLREFEDTPAARDYLVGIQSQDFKEAVQRFGVAIFSIIRRHLPEYQNCDVFLENLWDNAMILTILMDDQTGIQNYGGFT